MRASSLGAGFPPDLREIAWDKRIPQCFTWNFVNAGAILLIFASYLLLEDARSEIAWTLVWPALAGGCALLGYDAMRRRRRRTLVVSCPQVAVYRGSHLEQMGNIDEFVYKGSQFNLRELISNHFALQLACISVVLGFIAALAAFVFSSIALFGHSVFGVADSTRDRLFAMLACLPSLGFIVNLVLSAYFRVEVAYKPAAPGKGFELLIARSAARSFRPSALGEHKPYSG